MLYKTGETAIDKKRRFASKIMPSELEMPKRIGDNNKMRVTSRILVSSSAGRGVPSGSSPKKSEISIGASANAQAEKNVVTRITTVKNP